MQSDPITLWHALLAKEVIDRLASDATRGLAATDAAQRLAVHGPNRLAEGSDLKLYIVQLRVKQRSHGRDVVFHGNNIYLF